MLGKRQYFYNTNGKKPAVGGGGLFVYVAGTLGSVLVGMHE